MKLIRHSPLNVVCLLGMALMVWVGIGGCVKNTLPKEKTYAEELERQKQEKKKEREESLRHF